MKKTLYVRTRNAMHPGYGECSRCSGNWGWKKHKSHMTSKTSGLFLFCEECDKIVTKKERWDALNEWKIKCIEQLLDCHYSMKKMARYIIEVENTEFIEFPKEDE